MTKDITGSEGALHFENDLIHFYAIMLRLTEMILCLYITAYPYSPIVCRCLTLLFLQLLRTNLL